MTSTLTKPRRKLRMQAGEPCPRKSDPRPENRVVGSGGFTYSCTWSTWSQTPDTRREIETTSTTTVSGALEWLSKDPIGISGGLNQYVFCGNNPVNARDPYGLLDSLFGGDVHGSLVLGAGPVGGIQGILGPEGVSGIYGYHNLLTLEGEECNETYGLDIGAAGQLVFGLGNGSYEGPFRSVNLGYTWLTGSVYWSPGAWTGVWRGKPGWIGINIGGNFGLPLTIAWERTWFHKLFPRDKKNKKCE